MTNIKYSEFLFKKLASLGVSEYIYCSGSRNAPLIQVLARAKGLKSYSFFEERSAAFFALGRIRRYGRPVAVITTSGTAVAELLPACIEAHYNQAPLVLITADRPQAYRGTGAPQSIEQVGIFSNYVQQGFDLNVSDEFSLSKISSPIHLNICFDEPLVDDELGEFNFKVQAVNEVGQKTNSEQKIHLEKPLVILSGLNQRESQQVEAKFKGHNALIYVEAPSGLRGSESFKDSIQSGNKYIQKIFKEGEIGSVLRIGSVPTLRFWRDLEQTDIPITVVSSWKGLARENVTTISMNDFLNADLKIDHINKEQILLRDKKRCQSLSELYERYPNSEASQMHKLSLVIANESVFMGNSLPIREWDLCASHNFKPKSFLANRGANGIDGLVSTFLGSDSEWLILGDLSALYDLSALWAKNFTNQKFKIVILNNSGGKIFTRLYKETEFQNEHTYNFSHWAKMFNVNYHLGLSCLKDVKESAESCILELTIDNTQSEAFWDEYNKI